MCCERAGEYLHWPNMAADIRQVVENCEACRSYERSQQKEIHTTGNTDAGKDETTIKS